MNNHSYIRGVKMNITDAISLSLFIVFGTAYSLKLVLLRQKNQINANVLAKKNKEFSIYSVEMLVRTSSFIWLLVWLTEIIFHNQIASFLDYFFMNSYIVYIGILIIALGVSIFIMAIIFMKTSWRVGIDKTTKTALVTHGIYRWSRNPAFVGFDLMFIGLFISYPNLLTLFVVMINIGTFHLLILQEEKHLTAMFGEEYSVYKKKVARYFLF